MVGDHARQRNTFRVDLPRHVRVPLLLLLVLALGAGLVVVGVTWVVPLFAPTYKTQFLVDAALGDGGADEVASVSEALATVVGNSGDDDSQSLRTFGGECGAEGNTAQLVGFGTGNHQDITAAARSVRRGGRATLQRGIVEAVADFSGPFSLKATQVSRIIVVTRHAADACDPDEEFVRAQIRDRVTSAGLGIEFRFIGHRIEQEDRPDLAELTSELKAPQPTYTRSQEELNAALHWFATAEPVLRSSQSVLDVLNPTVDRLDAATEATEATEATVDGRFDLAGTALAEARSADVDDAIEDLESRGRSPDAARPLDHAVRLRDLRGRVLDAADGLFAVARSGQDPKAAQDEYRRAAEDYNREARTMTDELARLRAKGPGGAG
ncbi:hypothetical protein [Saccharothrix sp. NRRL B-16348]|uniref:hypothetical protein n=1 Tax=Saccharothrix sp. NRRL B-16348 TaxID=1415542 RepID=UPI0006AE98B0|nr:hypothetical protein [Saccharothrix sp. NRRL B-16348]